MVQPLEGIRVLDFSVVMYGSICGMMLGDMGADVIKIESLEGNFSRGRSAAATWDTGGELKEVDDAGWLGNNRSKRGLAVDITKEEGRDIILKLAKVADVLLHQFRPGVMDRARLGYKDISSVNPRIIYANLYGFGETGPLARRIGGDMWTQAMAGAVSLGGSPDGPLYLSPVAWVDEGGACVAAFGIVVALLTRERTGIGQELTTCLLDSCLHMQCTEAAKYLIDGMPLKKMGRGWAPGNFPYGAYRARDGDVVTIYGAGNQWPDFCKLLGVEDLATDPRYDTQQKRSERRHELYPLLDEAFSKKTRAEWQQTFREAKMRCDPCLTYDELFAPHPQLEANQMLITMNHPERGPLRMIGIPIKFKKTPANPTLAPPLLGQHTPEILLSLGYTEKEIADLEQGAVIKIARPEV